MSEAAGTVTGGAVTAAELEADCRVLEKVVLQERLADEADLARKRPGGMDNPDLGPRGWLRYFATLHRRHARVEFGQADAATELRVLDALRARPVEVELTAPFDGRTHLVAPPKSAAAMVDLAGRDDVIDWCRARMRSIEALEALGEPVGAAGLEAHIRLRDESFYQLKVALWTLAHEGPGLPYPPENARPVLPDWLGGALSPLDYAPLYRAYLEANAGPLAAMERWIPIRKPVPPSQLPRFGLMFATGARTLGVETSRLMRDWSLVQFVTTLRLIRAGEAEETERAEAQRGGH